MAEKQHPSTQIQGEHWNVNVRESPWDSSSNWNHWDSPYWLDEANEHFDPAHTSLLPFFPFFYPRPFPFFGPFYPYRPYPYWYRRRYYW